VRIRKLAKPEFGFPDLSTQPRFKYPVRPVKTPVPVDYSEFFSSELTFPTRTEAITWAKSKAMEHNFCIIIGRDKKSNLFRKGKTWLLCEKEGANTPSKELQRDSRSKKCGCGFSLMCTEVQRDDWRINVKCGTHNHMICESLHGNPLAGRPTAKEFEIIKNMTLGHVPPSKIATVLDAEPGNVTSRKQLYNNMQKVRMERMDGRTIVQDFLYQCHEKNYYTEYRINAKTNQIQDIFFAHPDSLELLRAFPHIIVLDSTYSTTR